MNQKILFLNFGQYAGTPFYFYFSAFLARHYDYEVVFITDPASYDRLDTSNLIRNFCIKTINPTYKSIKTIIQENLDAFIVFGNILFAFPCVDFIETLNFCIQSTVFFRKVYIDQNTSYIGSGESEVINYLDNMTYKTFDIKKIEKFFDGFLMKNYSELYSISSPTADDFDYKRGDFYQLAGAHPLVVSCETRILKFAKKIYSYYKEKHKIDFILKYYPKFSEKIGSLIPCVEMSNKLTNSNLKKKLKKKLILFFCGAKEFYHWHGDIALQIFKKLPNDYFMIILGEVPPEELSKLNDDELKRIKTGIVNDFSYIKSIFEETMVLLAMNRQIVSYSVLESIYYNIVCLFSDKITSYSNGNISRLENAGGIYIQSDNIDDYVNAILQLQRNPQMFLEHISTQKRFIQEGYHLEKVVKQFIMDNF